MPDCLAARVGLSRSLRELTLRAACGCLSRGCAALGSNPGGFVHKRLTARCKKGQNRALSLSAGGEGGITRAARSPLEGAAHSPSFAARSSPPAAASSNPVASSTHTSPADKKRARLGPFLICWRRGWDYSRCALAPQGGRSLTCVRCAFFAACGGFVEPRGFVHAHLTGR